MFIGGLVVLLLTAALVAPYFINWSSYRAEFEAEATRILGRQVTVRGDASARLLPFPSVTFADVEVAGTEPGQPAMTAATFSMDAELAPFMSGEFRIFDMRLVQPHLRIVVDESGAVDWAVRPNTRFDPRQISVEALTITDGQVDLVHGPSGSTHSLSGLDATLSARSLAGPWRMEGVAEIDGQPAALAVSTGAVDESGSMRLRVGVTPQQIPFSVDLDGTLQFEGTQPNYTGTLRLAARNEAAVPTVDGAENAAPQAEAVPAYRLTGSFALESDRFALPDYRFETGPLDNPYTAEGSAELSLEKEPSFFITADGAQVRFDETVAGAAGPGITLEQRIAALERVVNALPKPTIPGTVEVNLPAVVAGDTTIRDVRLSAQPDAGGWRLQTFAATLPGRTTLEGSGVLRVGEDFGFSGELLLAVAQPSGFAAWLSRDVDEAIRVLPAAGFDAKVDISRTRQSLTDLELQLGDARFRGAVERAQPPNARPSIRVELDGDALDVDGLAAFASIFVSDRGETRLADHDLDFTVQAGPVRAYGLVADSLDTALRLRADRLEIDRLAISGLAGASISATGSLDHLDAQPTGDIDASLIATDLAPLVEQLAARFPQNPVVSELQARAVAYPGLFADTRLDVVASAAAAGDGARGLAVSARGTSGGTRLQLTASSSNLDKPILDLPLILSLDAANEDGAALLALAGLPALPLGLLDRTEADLQLHGTLAGGLRTSATLRSTDLDGGFDGTVFMRDGTLRAQGDARLTAGDIEPWLMTTGLGVRGMGLGAAVGLAGPVSLAEGRLEANVQGSWNGGDVQGTISGEVIEGRPHLAGDLFLADLDLETAAGMVTGIDPFEAGPAGEWSQTPFASQVLLPFTVDLKLNAGELEVGIGLLVSDASFGLRLDGEGLRITDLKGEFAGGTISGLVSLQNAGGNGLLSAQLALANGAVERVSGNEALGGQGDFGITVSASGKSPEAMVAALSGSGTVTLKGLTISGLNPTALPALLAQADQIGRTVDQIAVAEFAPGIVGQGVYQAGDAEAAFAVANGVFRAPLTTFAAPESTMAVDLTFDARTTTVNGQATIAYQPGNAALVGSEPTVTVRFAGPVENPDVTYDTAALSQFLTQRALEIEQARVEAMQALLLEQQRLRRETRYYAALQDARNEAERLRQEEEQRQRAEEEARQQAEQARRDAEEQAQAAAAAAQAARDAAIEAAPQPQPTPAPTTTPSPPVEVPPLDLPLGQSSSQSLQPLQPPSAPGAGGTLPGVFQNLPDG
ncbi:AsmA family protein [Tianweitania sediminis]|uniref:AsmA family protein n=1 Tax=Tianweitania sediminis TaxID=1502156 RepID=UPI0031595F65